MHKNNLLLSLIALMTFLPSTEGKAAGVSIRTKATSTPKIVVNIIVDQLRTDHLEAFAPLYGNDGLRLLLERGRIYTQPEYPYAGTDRAAAIATLATGSTPSAHGIVAQQWLNRETLRPLLATEDRNVRGVGTVDQYSPRWLDTSTVGDELKIASGGNALVVSIAPEADAAIFSAGHAADQVVWMDSRTGNWVTSSYYGTLPHWADYRNVHHNTEIRLQKQSWKPLTPQTVQQHLLLSTQKATTFDHRFKDAARFVAFKTSALINDDIASTAALALQATHLGTDATPDLLNVTLYAGTYRNQPAATLTAELQDTYARLDQAVATIIDATHKKVGEGNALFALTSTGCFIEEEEDNTKHRIPTGTLDMRRTTGLLGMFLVAIYGQGNYIDAAYGNEIYLNHRLIEERRIDLDELQQRAQNFLLQLSGVKDVFTAQRLRQGTWTPELERRKNAFSTQRSGDIALQVRSGWKLINTDTQQQTTARETFLAFPLILYGTGVERDIIDIPVAIDRLAPTLSKAMRIRAPNAARKAPLP